MKTVLTYIWIEIISIISLLLFPMVYIIFVIKLNRMLKISVRDSIKETNVLFPWIIKGCAISILDPKGYVEYVEDIWVTAFKYGWYLAEKYDEEA